MRDRLSELLTWATFSLGVFVLGGATLEGMVYLPNWFHDIPSSLVTAREFLAVRNPGNFFQLFVPALVVLALATIAIGWHRRKVRWAVVVGLLLLVAAEIMTFKLVYPNIRIVLSEDVMTRSIAEIQQASQAFFLWGFWVRVPLMVVALGCFLYSARSMTALRATSTGSR